MKFFIGTSGWSYPKGKGTWNGYFYPAGRVNELEFYSRFFKTVELNSSFYRPPEPAYALNWVKQTPADFIFTVKLWQKFTHPGMFEAATGEIISVSRDDIDLFCRAIQPLVDAGKMGALLAQFPPSFKNGDTGRRILEAVIRNFSIYPLAVELRHRSWSDDKNIHELLRQNDVAWVNIDEPKFNSSVASDLPYTPKISYFRFHGRNAETWWNGNNETRYQYLYSPSEIAELSQKVIDAGRQSAVVFAFFNNHWKAWAPRNAVDMIQALQLPMDTLPAFSTGMDLEE